MTNAELQAMLAKMAQNQDTLTELAKFQLAQKEPAGTPIVPPIYGRQGLFGHCDDRTIINASVQDAGLTSWLNWRPSILRNEPIPVLTHASMSDDQVQDGPCDTCPQAQFGGCTMDFCFGRICVDTPEFQVLQSHKVRDAIHANLVP